MAEEVNPQTAQQENASEDVMKEKGNRLFELASKKELSDDEKKEISEHIAALPQALMSKSFMEHFKVPDMISLYQSGKSVQEILEQNAAAMETLSVVLENLKDVKLPDGRTASKYILDNAWLANGELIGTQFAKNIHFLGTAYTDEKTENLQSSELHEAIDKSYDQTTAFYEKLYGKEGYQANPKSHNVLGQKVEDVMHAVREESKKTTYRCLADLKDQECMQAPRQEFVVEKAREDMTIQGLKEAQYRGTLTADQAAALKKMEEKEADLENYNGDQKRPADDGGKKEKFKDEDIIKYMYEEWFLAGMSWIFDKVEDGTKIILDKLLYGGYDYNQPVPLKAASTEDGKSFVEKVNAFNDSFKLKRSQIHSDYVGGEVNGQHIEGRKEKVAKLGRELLEFCVAPSPEKEDDLKQRYGEAFIDKIKEDYQKDPQSVAHFLTHGSNSMLLMMETAEIFAQQTAHLEMLSEAMHDKSKWLDPKTGKFKGTSELEAERNAKAEKIREELIKSCLIVAEEERSSAQIRFSGLNTDEEKDQFVQDEILNTAKPEDQEKLKAEYQHLKGDPAKLEQWVCETIGAQRMVAYLDQQSKDLIAAERLIMEDMNQSNFDANGKKPRSDGRDILDKLRTERKQIQEAGAHDAELEGGERLKATLEHATDLLSAAKQNNAPIPFEYFLKRNKSEEEALKAKRERNNERLKPFQALERKIRGKNKYQKLNLSFTKPGQGRS